LDEPVSGLDPIARVQYRETIKRLQNQGMTILISSHILSDLEDFCTSIGIMELGRLVESSQLQTLYQRDRQDQQIIIATLGNVQTLQHTLQQSSKVTACEAIAKRHRQLTNQSSPHLSNTICIRFNGDQKDAANLLRSLIEQGHQITEFSPVQESLEDIFLKLGYQQTS
jgi:ABC-2 type transport system ATP-binding protein